MIRLIEALRYRSLRYVSQPLEQFHVLVGPNASGKSTFLDAVAFLGDLLRDGPEGAVLARAPTSEELTWRAEGRRFDLAVELEIPQQLQGQTEPNGYRYCRYEVAVGRDEPSGEIKVLGETFWLKTQGPEPQQQRIFFPMETEPPQTVVGVRGDRTWRKVVNKVEQSGNDYFQSETGKWNNLFRLGPTRAALANLPEDETRFPVATWAKRFLMEGIQKLALSGPAMRDPASPIGPKGFKVDGSNLPVVVRTLQDKDESRFGQWIEHVRTALPDLRAMKTVERPADRHLFLELEYEGGLKVPAWLVSDGTLRLLALTLLAYLPGRDKVYLVEEPENGIHPRAGEAVFQSLSSAYEAQILVATHSPVVLGLAAPGQILCFSKTPTGATDIVLGTNHPKLKDWRNEVALSDLYAAGVLG